ncbi:MAG: response regulator [Sulfurimonas sp.]
MNKIFLLEDDFSLNETIKEMLEKDGFKVDSFYNGEKALENILQDYALYILDINVPNIDGLFVLEKIKNTNPNSKVIIISANIDINKITQAYEKDCDDYIKKPFDLQEFRLKVRKISNSFDILKIDNELFFNMKTKVLYTKKEEISLTKLEKKLLFLLLQNKDKKVTHQNIENFVYEGVSKNLYGCSNFGKKS